MVGAGGARRPRRAQAALLRPRDVVGAVLATVLASPAAAQPAPTVVFEAGLGDGAAVWDATKARLGPTVSTFAYDRPGYGRTPAAATPRDACTIARELHVRLSAAARPPPYVLVGHSLGGRYAYAFARLYPQETSGLILVDATPPGHLKALNETVPAAGRLLKIMRATVFTPTARREFDAQDACLETLPRTPFAFPVRVLVKTKADPAGGARFLQVERDLAETWLAMTGASAIEPVEGASHHIQRDQPEALATIIRQILAFPRADALEMGAARREP